VLTLDLAGKESVADPIIWSPRRGLAEGEKILIVFILASLDYSSGLIPHS
jgi:hypothetical protein